MNFDLSAAVKGTTYGIFLTGFGEMGGGFMSSALTGFPARISVPQGIFGGAIAYSLVYGIGAGILGEDICAARIKYSALGLLGLAYSTIPVNFLGGVLGYCFFGSTESFGSVAVNAAVGSAFIPATATTIAAIRYAAIEVNSLYMKGKTKVDPTNVSTSSTPSVLDIEMNSEINPLASSELESASKSIAPPSSTTPSQSHLGFFSQEVSRDSQNLHNSSYASSGITNLQDQDIESASMIDTFSKSG